MNLIDENECNLNAEMTKYCLRIFRRYIEIENEDFNKQLQVALKQKTGKKIHFESYKWEYSEWVHYKHEIKKA